MTARAPTVVLGTILAGSGMTDTLDTRRTPTARGVVAPAPTCVSHRVVQVGDPSTSRLASPVWRAAKRGLDLIVAVPLAILITPLVIVAMLAVMATDWGRPIFRQRRLGRDGEEIAVYKIRTMCHDAEHWLRADEALYRLYLERGHKLHAHEDPRILPVGRLLRRTSIDELPQVYLVVAGKMSLVGPRPVPRGEFERLYGATYWRHYEAVRPGLTGLWQVSGRNHVRGEDRAALDARYVMEWSLLGDVRILMRTIPAVLSGHGAH